MAKRPPPLNLEVLTNRNLLLYAARNYDNRHCHSTEEFLEDLARIKHIKKLLTRYEKTGELRTRLILNHIMVLNNCFGPQATVRILFLKMEPQLKYIKPFLILLDLLPDVIWNVGVAGPIYTDMVPLDQGVVNEVRQI